MVSPASQVLEYIRSLPGSVEITFESRSTTALQGNFIHVKGPLYIRKCMGHHAPAHISDWHLKYLVLGGYLANPNVLQVPGLVASILLAATHACFIEFLDFTKDGTA